MKSLRAIMVLIAAVILLLCGTAMAAGQYFDANKDVPELVNPVTTDADGQVQLEGETLMDFIFPSTINGAPVTTIGPYSFFGCELFRTVTIPAGISQIGEDAFANCPNLTTIILDGRADTSDMVLGDDWSGHARVVCGLVLVDQGPTEQMMAYEAALTVARDIGSVDVSNLAYTKETLATLEQAYLALSGEERTEDLVADYQLVYDSLSQLIQIAEESVDAPIPSVSEQLLAYHAALTAAQDIGSVDVSNLAYAKETLSTLEQTYLALSEEERTEVLVADYQLVYDSLSQLILAAEESTKIPEEPVEGEPVEEPADPPEQTEQLPEVTEDEPVFSVSAQMLAYEAALMAAQDIGSVSADNLTYARETLATLEQTYLALSEAEHTTELVSTYQLVYSNLSQLILDAEEAVYASEVPGEGDPVDETSQTDEIGSTPEQSAEGSDAVPTIPPEGLSGPVGQAEEESVTSDPNGEA